MDHLLQDSEKARMVVQEAHPEVCFRGLSGAPMRYAKKKREGFRERLKCLSRHLPEASAIAAGAFLEHGGYEVGRDDVLDALVLAFCASHAPDCITLPETPERDPKGLRMEMVYLPAERSDQPPNPLPPGRSA
jgi:predicted RNase H-like nuclease